VSPSNLFVSRTGDLKLGDFGVARGRMSGALDPKLLGKPFYFSPEVIDGHVSPAADLWATTVTLYELLALQRPFLGQTPEEVFEAVRKRRYIPIRKLRPDVSEALAQVIDRGLSQEPVKRFQTAGDFASALIPLYDERVGTPLAISAVVRGLF